MGLIEAVGAGPVALDTAPFIYFIEDHPLYGPAVEPLFRAIDREEVAAVTTGVTLIETLAVPLRRNEPALAGRYETFLTRSRGLRMVELDRSILRTAAEIRAATGAKTPDALQLAGAVSAGCTAILTNDRRLPRLPGLDVLRVKDFL